MEENSSNYAMKKLRGTTAGGKYQPLSEGEEGNSNKLTTVGGDKRPLMDRTSSLREEEEVRSPSLEEGGGEYRTIPLFGIGDTKFKYSSFPANVFCNQKYSIVTFLPILLFEQFKYFFNLYFLLVAISQFFPAFKVGMLVTYIGPLVFVLLITIGKEAYDDYKRYLRDCQANSQLFTRLVDTDTVSEETIGINEEPVPSAQIRVGDLIYLNKDQRVPADLALLWTSDPSGTCFIRTDQLDGETDWKIRIAVQGSQALGPGLCPCLRGTTQVETPQKDIYSFSGTLTATSPTPFQEPLNLENTLWANTVLASGSAIGVVLYTGKETRAALNTSHPGTKVGIFDLEVNGLAKILCAVTFGISFLLILLNGFGGLWYVYLLRFLIIFSSIIPISLRVNLDFAKIYYAFIIEKDSQISGTLVRSSTISEELGRVNYLLTDKTGTLTQNDMVMKKIHLGTMAYSLDTMDEISHYIDQSYPELTTNTNTNSSSDKTHRRRSSSNLVFNTNANLKARRDLRQRVYDLIEALSVCHNVTPVMEETGDVNFQASSPDEVAIIKFVASVGLTLSYRDLVAVKLTAPNNQEKAYDILHVFPFNSVTKRMGVIVRESSTGDCTFFLKGADVTMTPLVIPSQWLEEECNNMAREGLRTLVIARKRLTASALAAFEKDYHSAKLSLSNRAQLTQEAITRHLEFNLELLGLTGVEDKLQDQVKNTLEALRNAGLKIWMLTGDKVETATCIAISSKLVSRNQTIHQICKLDSITSAQSELELLSLKKDCCLVIDGESINLYLDHLRDEFVSLAVELPAVVCCRCTPTQKADITRLIKDFTGSRVCAIGDGGNDVSMIQAADVGVGIVGKEGKQASLAADFSVLQFSYLTRLLVWHGRNSYKRSSKLTQFVIHRGLIISVMQAVFSAIFYFAPIALYRDMILAGYPTFYTMGPVLSLILDQDVDEDIAIMYPELYKELTKGRSMSLKTFFWWLIISLYQGGAIMLLALWLFDTEFINIVSISFTSLILNELLMVALSINTWHPYMIAAEFFSLFAYFVSMLIIKTDFDLSFMITLNFIWKVLAITAVSSLPLYFVKLFSRLYNPPSYTKLS